MKSVRKYDLLGPGSLVALELPVGAEIIHVDHQSGRAHLWAVGETSAPRERREFLTAGDDWPLPDRPMRHLGSVVVDHAMYGLTWHVFEVTN